MDEILIDDKKYISSKRAAKATGYAKDYVGQLCREGRIQAKLVGRSWYVLESALQDYRFGSSVQTTADDFEAVVSTAPVLPSLSKYKNYEEALRGEPAEDLVEDELKYTKENIVEDLPQPSENSWSAWLDIVATEPPNPMMDIPVPDAIEQDRNQTRTQYEIEEEDEDPADTIQEDEEPIKNYVSPRENRNPSLRRRNNWLLGKIIRLIQAFGVMIVVTLACIITLNSGYLDKYIASVKQVAQISGISIYEK